MSKSELKSIKSICMIFDADQKLAKDAFEEKFNKKNTDMIINKLDFIRGSCSIKDEYIKLYYYFLPDNYSKGTLEDLLLSSASVVYPDLLRYVNEYIDKVGRALRPFLSAIVFAHEEACWRNLVR